MIKLLANVVDPNLSAKFDDETNISIIRLLTEIRDSDLPSLKAEVAFLHIYPDQKTDLYKRINEALISNQDKTREDALNAVAILVINANDDDINSMENNPISMLSQYITWCPTHSISSALLIISRTLKKPKTILPHSLEVTIQRRLNRLLIETAYDSDTPDMNFDEKLEVRCLSSIVAAALWKYYRSQGLFIPESVEKWREACLSHDEFSEVRNSWEFYENVCSVEV